MLCCAVVVAIAGGSATPARAVISAARNGSIVFQRFDTSAGMTRLYVVQPDGRGLRALARAPAPDSEPSWSPDGRKIVFRRLVDAGGVGERAQISVVGADGRGLRNLTRASCNASCVANEEPAWSPDGKRIAFVRTLGQQPPGKPRAVGIFVINADGTHARSVRSLPHGWPGAGAPSWSPDGKRLLYSTYCWFGNCGQPPVGAQLFTVGLDGKTRQLTRLSGNSLAPRWSPDGKKIVFVRNARAGPGGDVYVVGADGKGLRRVTRAPDLGARGPDWGPAPPVR